MRYFMTLALALALATPSLALADFQATGTGDKLDSVAQIQNAVDDAPVVLEGVILQKVDGDDNAYVFRDSTGQVEVDIDQDAFKGQQVTPNTKVRITGKVDRQMMGKNKIDVTRIETR